MASDVQICNLALSHLGDSADVASIDPPEGSAQAGHCALFYPMARDGLLEMHEWSFATKRVALAELPNVSSTWAYCYAQPVDMLNALAVLASDAQDDTSVARLIPNTFSQDAVAGLYTPQPFALESAADGTDIVYTNQANAVLRYTARVADTSKFSPLFVLALAGSLASMLAGPVIKGDAGAAAAARWQVLTFGRDGRSGLFGQAAASDAGDRRSTSRDRQQVPWINAR